MAMLRSWGQWNSWERYCERESRWKAGQKKSFAFDGKSWHVEACMTWGYASFNILCPTEVDVCVHKCVNFSHSDSYYFQVIATTRALCWSRNHLRAQVNICYSMVFSHIGFIPQRQRPINECKRTNKMSLLHCFCVSGRRGPSNICSTRNQASCRRLRFTSAWGWYTRCRETTPPVWRWVWADNLILVVQGDYPSSLKVGMGW